MSLGLRLSSDSVSDSAFLGSSCWPKEFAWRPARSSIYKGSTSDYVLLALNFTRKHSQAGQEQAGWLGRGQSADGLAIISTVQRSLVACICSCNSICFRSCGFWMHYKWGEAARSDHRLLHWPFACTGSLAIYSLTDQPKWLPLSAFLFPTFPFTFSYPVRIEL